LVLGVLHGTLLLALGCSVDKSLGLNSDFDSVSLGKELLDVTCRRWASDCGDWKKLRNSTTMVNERMFENFV
jgi:hypothetical protein